MSVKCEIKNHKKIVNELNKMKEAPKRALAAAEADIRKRAPGWIASGVVDRYNLEGGKRAGKTAILNGEVGNLEIKGSLLKNDMEFHYSGRLLTPTHFGMNPTDKPKPWTPYTLKWKVLKASKGTTVKIKELRKKQKKNIGRNYTHQSTQNSPKSPWMLQYTGNKKEDGVNYIPFQRRGQSDPMKHVARTVSLPQMVTQGKDGPLRPEVATHFHENLEKRVMHNINRYMGKK